MDFLRFFFFSSLSAGRLTITRIWDPAVLARKTARIDPAWIFKAFTQHCIYQFISILTEYEPCIPFYLLQKLENHTSCLCSRYLMAIFELLTWFLCHQTILELGSREIREGAK